MLTRTAPPSSAIGPLAAAYARLGDAYPDLRVRLAPLDGGTSTARLAADPRPEIAEEAARGRAEYGEELRPDVAAGFALHRRLWPTALLFTVPWLVSGALPQLTTHQVAFDAGRSTITVDPAGLRVLPDAAPDAVRRALAAHFGPLLRGYRPFVRRGPRMLWGLATDDVVEGLWYIGHRLGRETEAREALNRLLPGGTSPFTGAAGFAPPGCGSRTRVSCCLYYTVSGTELCATCPRRIG